MRSLSDYLDLTAEQARSQWGRILGRKPKSRQEPFTPVEAILCYGLFFVVDPHRYGGGRMDQAPPIVHGLARLFVRSSASIKKRVRSLAGDAETTRIAEQSVRLGQHRFATSVLENYAHSCAFCGFAPRSLPKHKLLVASHIKPWADSDDRERLDPRNGVAACPTHDAAFDTGLITVNGELRVHRAPRLDESSRTDPGVDRYFGQVLRPTLVVPTGGQPPGDGYLSWHREHIYRGHLAG